MDLLRAAVAENATWCALVCRRHGVDSTVRDGRWIASGTPPPFYPAVITLRPKLQLSTIVRPQRGLGVKDSYADVDLSSAGAIELFSGRWIAAPPGQGELGQWRRISDARELARWRSAHGSADALQADLLGEPDVTFVCAGEAGHLLAGAVLHRTDEVIGVSNVFGHVDWRSLIAVAGAFHGELPVVGYASGAALAAARHGGWSEVGPMRVWLAG